MFGELQIYIHIIHILKNTYIKKFLKLFSFSIDFPFHKKVFDNPIPKYAVISLQLHLVQR